MSGSRLEPSATAFSSPTPGPFAAAGSTRLRRLGLLSACVIALAIGSVGLTDGDYASPTGDMPRYLMNGVFIHDLMADRPFGGWSELVEYARLYYARYPAISLGHHAVLLPILEAPTFALFGISITAARLVPLAALLIAVVCLHGIVNRRYGPVAAFWASALFATSPLVVTYTRTVMAEMPALALVLTSAYYLQRFCDTGRRWALVACSTAFVLSLYAKPLTLLVAPALIASALVEMSSARLLKHDVLIATAAVAVFGAPAIAVPLLVSSTNARGVMDVVSLQPKATFLHLLAAALQPQLAWPVLVAAGAAAARAIVRRETRAVLFLIWIAGVTPALYFFGGLANEGSRYTLYWVPALCALAGALAADCPRRAAQGVIAGGLAIAVAMHVLDTRTVAAHITGMGGYEEAAQFVLQSDPGPTVLFSGNVDTGYFAFFVRKHDPARNLVVLRSDKVYTTSLMGHPSFEDRIVRRDEIYPVLHRLGTRYVVIEDGPSRSQVLEWLREELKSLRFCERRRIPIRSAHPRLLGTSLAIFELLDYTPPSPDAVLSLHMPIVGQSLTVRLRDLIDRKLLR